MRLALTLNQGEEYLAQDAIFHETLVNLCNNSYFMSSFDRISAIMDTARNFLGNNLEHMQNPLLSIRTSQLPSVREILAEL